MPSRRKPKRNYRMIAFKVYYDTDQDILDWWDNIEDGERSDEIRDVIRDYLEENPTPRRKVLEIPELLDVRRDTIWIKDTLNDMPAYLERVIQHVATNAQPIAVVQNPPRASPQVVEQADPALTDAESERRTRRMKCATRNSNVLWKVFPLRPKPAKSLVSQAPRGLGATHIRDCTHAAVLNTCWTCRCMSQRFLWRVYDKL